jgi:pyridoxal phosphate enzyme (YggS family)
MTSIAANLQAIRQRISLAAERSGRSAADIKLVAVSKTFSAGDIREAWACGQAAFGESYLQEAAPKIDDLAGTAVEWHFIGPVQSNKTRAIAERFAWVHGVDRERVAARLDAARPPGLPPLNVCIQVNVSGEATKGGVAPGAEESLALAIAGLPRLRLRGLMTIPEPTTDAALRRQHFARLRQTRDDLAVLGIALDTLSMGMSDDFETAIEEGATLVRVGTAIFGLRP